jgi:hypothetical protein
MKKIGILTLQNSNNFGAMYQAYALQQYLKGLGHDVFIINYEMTRDSHRLNFYVSHFFSLLLKLYNRGFYIKKILGRSNSKPLNKNAKTKYAAIFSEFRDKYLKITKSEYDYIKLSNSSPQADVFICGSDQVWAADFLFTSPAYLLGFVRGKTKKVSYAPSFGKKTLEYYLKKTFKKHINDFDSISVRENSGKEIISALSGLTAQVVLDPTLLLSKSGYASLINYSYIPDKPYLLVYVLNQEEDLMKWTIKMVNYVKEKTGYKVIYVTTNSGDEVPSEWNTIYPTPNQFLGLIDKATLVMTNSFHGTVFSLIMEKNFISMARDKYLDKQNLRIKGLTKELGVENRFLEPYSKTQIMSSFLETDIDYKKVNKALAPLRDKSYRFLENAIK